MYITKEQAFDLILDEIKSSERYGTSADGHQDLLYFIDGLRGASSTYEGTLSPPPDILKHSFKPPFVVGQEGMFVFDREGPVGDLELPRHRKPVRYGFRTRGHGRLAGQHGLPGAWEAWIRYSAPLQHLALSTVARLLNAAWGINHIPEE